MKLPSAKNIRLLSSYNLNLSVTALTITKSYTANITLCETSKYAMLYVVHYVVALSTNYMYSAMDRIEMSSNK